MKTRRQKRSEAEQRQEGRDKRTPKEQIKLLRIRPGKSVREINRLMAQLKSEEK